MRRLGRVPEPRAILTAATAAVAMALPAVAETDCALSPQEIFAKVGDSVVQVLAIGINPFLVYDRLSARTGTGYVIDDGLIATNYHVIAGADEIVVFVGQDGFNAQVVGVDPALDIAVIESPLSFVLLDFGPPLELAPAEDLTIGQPAFAIGFPFGIGKTISSGIVSGSNRVLGRTTSSWLSPMLQTDAAISPGNSGGPLVDACGRLIGMVTSGISAEGAENLGFAIPVEVLGPVLEEIAATGKVARPWHGLYGQMTTPPVLLLLGIPEERWEKTSGFLVETVEPGSAADRAGLIGGSWPIRWGGTEILLGGDIITHVNGVRVDSRDTALTFVRELEIGEPVHLVFRRDGVRHEATVLIEERPILDQELEIYRNAEE